MSSYLEPIRAAIVIFPFLAFILALPFLVGQYRRYGAFSWWRAFVLYTFVFYLLTAYFLIILPLPPISEVAHFTGPRYNLVPFMALREFLSTTVFKINDPHTWLAALKQPGFIQPTFNIILTIPFGFYLRYYFKRSMPQIIMMSFGLSLFFELTQLSGLYGIYPRPYRLFDVDDLMLNTTGGLVGGLVAPIIMRILPSRDQIDAQSVAKGDRVTLTRRLSAFVIDFVLLVTFVGILSVFLFDLLGLDRLPSFIANYLIPVIIIFGFYPAIHPGQTPGKRLVKIQIVTADGHVAKLWRVWLREALLYGFALPSLSAFWNTTVDYFVTHHQTDITLALMVFFGLLSLLLVADVIWTLVTRRERFFYDAWAATTQRSTFTPQRSVVHPE